MSPSSNIASSPLMGYARGRLPLRSPPTIVQSRGPCKLINGRTPWTTTHNQPPPATHTPHNNTNTRQTHANTQRTPAHNNHTTNSKQHTQTHETNNKHSTTARNTQNNTNKTHAKPKRKHTPGGDPTHVD